jgi:hypothetical protein
LRKKRRHFSPIEKTVTKHSELVLINEEGMHKFNEFGVSKRAYCETEHFGICPKGSQSNDNNRNVVLTPS